MFTGSARPLVRFCITIFGVSDLPMLYEALGLPEDVRFVAVVTLGYPATDADKPSTGASLFTRRRKPREEILRWETWD